MYHPLYEKFYQVVEDWDWDRNKEVMSNRLVTTVNKFGNIISIVCSKQLLEPM